MTFKETWEEYSFHPDAAIWPPQGPDARTQAHQNLSRHRNNTKVHIHHYNITFNVPRWMTGLKKKKKTTLSYINSRLLCVLLTYIYTHIHTNMHTYMSAGKMRSL